MGQCHCLEGVTQKFPSKDVIRFVSGEQTRLLLYLGDQTSVASREVMEDFNPTADLNVSAADEHFKTHGGQVVNQNSQVNMVGLAPTAGGVPHGMGGPGNSSLKR